MNTPTPSNSVVTEAMIEAGVSVVCGADHTFGKTIEGAVDMAVLRNDLAKIYLAMQSASTTGSDELVERAIVAALSQPLGSQER